MTFQRRQNPYQQRSPLNLAEAKKKVMDFVARRDHSEKELRTKLLQRCEPAIVDQALTWAKEQNWLMPAEILKDKFAEQLGRRGKGIRKINQKLKDLGLNPVKADQDTELEKAKKLVLAKWSVEDFRDLDFKESQKLKAKIIRFLVSRGYESDTVSKILKTEFKAGAVSNDEEY